MTMKKIYSRPITEVVSSAVECELLAGSPTGRLFTGKAGGSVDNLFNGTVMPVGEVNEKDITFIHGHNSDGDGNRAKGYNAWNRWDD